MVLFIIWGVVVLITFIVLGILFYTLSQEGHKKEEQKVVPLTDLSQLKKELSLETPEPQKPVVSGGDEIIPAFVPKAVLPTQEVQSPLEDDTYKKRAQELEDELRTIKQKAEEQVDVAREMIVTLTKENQSLKSQQAESAELEEARAKLTELQGEASGLKTENVNLQTQLESTNAKVQLLEEEIAQAKATVAELNREKEVSSSAPKPEPDETLRQDMEDAQQKLKELNTQLTEKNDSLQYELVKARAQSSGLERVSSNYKIQLEDFLKKINATQVTNEQLSQVKNRLEGMVSEVKLQNEELIKKDQLSQFELEKNRSRLLVLERDYEDLKARVQQQNQ